VGEGGEVIFFEGWVESGVILGSFGSATGARGEGGEEGVFIVLVYGVGL